MANFSNFLSRGQHLRACFRCWILCRLDWRCLLASLEAEAVPLVAKSSFPESSIEDDISLKQVYQKVTFYDEKNLKFKISKKLLNEWHVNKRWQKDANKAGCRFLYPADRQPTSLRESKIYTKKFKDHRYPRNLSMSNWRREFLKKGNYYLLIP